MITRLRMKNFKSFQDAELKLGPLTILIGTNASGKSNLRDVLRFLHGVGRRYTLPEIVGGKWGEGGYREWSGIRGGLKELVYNKVGNVLDIEVEGSISTGKVLQSLISVNTDLKQYNCIMDSNPNEENLKAIIELISVPGSEHLFFDYFMGPSRLKVSELIQDIPDENNLNKDLLKQFFLLKNKKYDDFIKSYGESFFGNLILGYFTQSLRFYDLSPEEMKNPSIPGQEILTDRGENLSSVLENICRDKAKKASLLNWLGELTPQDVYDLDFFEDQQGKILFNLIEDNGMKISANSISDGTLRFLGMLAAIMSSEPGGVFFFEEIENGIHPTRLHLLVQLLENQAKHTGVQVIISTHSPLLLDYISEESRKYASLIYRSKKSGSKIVRLNDIEDFSSIIQNVYLSDLHAEGWFEAVMSCVKEDDGEL